MMQPGAAGGPGQAAAAAAQPGAAPQPGAAGAPGQAAAAAAAAAQPGAAGGPTLVAAEPGAPKPEAELKAGDGKAKAEAELKQVDGPAKPDDAGAAPGGPKKDGDHLWQVKSDEELVDPDADRPDFGGGTAAGADGTGAEAPASEDEFGDFEIDDAEDGPRTAAKRGQRPRSKPIDPAYVTAGIMAAAVIAVMATIWFGRGMLEDLWPGVKGFYEKLGAVAEKPTDGLRISRSGGRLTRIDGVETLVVRGFVSNVSDTVKPLPGLKLQLLDANKEVIQEAANPAPAALLPPGGTVEYEVKLELPDTTRGKDFVVAWDE
jgi:hypothetical protein